MYIMVRDKGDKMNKIYKNKTFTTCTNGQMLKRVQHGKRNGAFTLGEVLIAIAIIGIVAALVMPRIVNFFKVKELESRFKRADATIQQIITKSVNELGYFNIKEIKTASEYSSAERNNLNDIIDNINEIYDKQFRYTRYVPFSELYAKGAKMHDFETGQVPYGFPGRYMTPSGTSVYLLPDGLAISKVGGGYCSGRYAIFIAFDTNGPFKGPNRMGYDLFYYRPQDNCISSGGFNYYYYAHRNKAINDNNKTYFEMLYK